jgi:hypothetical protein
MKKLCGLILFLLICCVARSTAQIQASLFRHRYLIQDLPGDKRWGFGCPAASDFDRDGDVDFAFGTLQDSIYWFEMTDSLRWIRHTVGHIPIGCLGAASLDADRDGWPDIVAGGYWYRNPQNPRILPFERFCYDPSVLKEIHDLVPADVNGDGIPEIVVLGDEVGCFWYSVPGNPKNDRPWPRSVITQEILNEKDDIHGGFAPNGLGDIDGDGDPDLVLPDRWLENRDRGRIWMRHALPFGKRGPWGLSCRSWIVDLDRDGDPDIVMSDSDQDSSRAAWMENLGGNPPRFEARFLPLTAGGVRGSFHSLVVADFDLDGDPDIFTVEQEDPAILPRGAGPRWFIWENMDGKAGRFVERVVFEGNLGGHDVRAMDADGDGDIDLYSKIWSCWPGNANGGVEHGDFLENRAVDKK